MILSIKASWNSLVISVSALAFLGDLLGMSSQDQLWHSLELNDEAGVKRAHQQGALLNLPRCSTHELPLYYAVTRTNSRTIEYLLQQGANPNQNSACAPRGVLTQLLDLNQTPEIIKAHKIELLLQYKATVTRELLKLTLKTNQFSRFCMLLRYAAKNNMLTDETLQELLKQAFELAYHNKYEDRDYPLILFLYGVRWADQEQEHYYRKKFIVNGQNKILELSAEHGVLPTFLSSLAVYQAQGLFVLAIYNYALSLLKLAVKGSNEEIVEEILRHSPLLTNKDKYEELKTASYDGKTNVVRAFLRQGVSPNPENLTTPALVLALNQRATKVARLLIEHGAYIDKTESFWPLMTVLRSRTKCFKLLVLLCDNGMELPTLDMIREIFTSFNSCPEFFSKALRLFLVYGCNFANASRETQEWVKQDFFNNYTGLNANPYAYNALNGVQLDNLAATFDDFPFILSVRDIANVWYLVGQAHKNALATHLSRFKAPIPLAIRIVKGILRRLERAKIEAPNDDGQLKEQRQKYETIKDMLEAHAQGQEERPLLLSTHIPPRSCSFANTLASILMG